MALGSLNGVIPLLRNPALVGQSASDAELLDRFVASRDAGAFEALVRRHGPMVFAVCRRILRHAHDAEDAFQATFFVLAYKAASVSPRGKLAGWLHGVASKTALKARHRAARRTQIESQVPPRSADVMPDAPCTEAEPLLDQELAALPDRYRLPIILCDLEGRLRSEAATALGCSEGTLSSRLTRGRRLLAERLKRRGVQLSVGALVGVLTARSTSLAEPFVRATVPVALAPVSAATVSPTVAQLATGVMKGMLLKKLQSVALAALVVAATAFGLSGVFIDRTEAAPTPKAPVVDEKALSEALANVDGTLLMNRKVARELRCDIDQYDRIMDKLEEAQRKAQQKTNEAMIGLKQNVNGNFNPQAIDQMIKDAHAAGEKEFRKAVNEVVTSLTVAQRQRLRQIDLQARGFHAFTQPSVAKELNLSAKQKEQFAENIKRAEEDMQQAFNKPVAPNGVVEFDFEKVTKENRETGLKRALAILTDDQKAMWKKMIGDPVKYPLNTQPGTYFARDLPLIGGGFGGVQVVPAVPVAPALPAPAPDLPPAKPEK